MNVVNMVLIYVSFILFLILFFFLTYSVYKLMLISNEKLKRKMLFEIINSVSMVVCFENQDLERDEKKTLILENVEAMLEAKKIKVLDMEVDLLIEVILLNMEVMKEGD